MGTSTPSVLKNLQLKNLRLLASLHNVDNNHTTMDDLLGSSQPQLLEIGFIRPEKYCLIKSCIEAVDSGEKINFEKVATTLRKAFCDGIGTRHPDFFVPNRCEAEFNAMLLKYKEQFAQFCQEDAPLERILRQMLFLCKRCSVDEQRDFFTNPANKELLNLFYTKKPIPPERREAVSTAVAKYLNFCRNYDAFPAYHIGEDSLFGPTEELPASWKANVEILKASNRREIENAKAAIKREAEAPTSPTGYVPSKLPFRQNKRPYISKKDREPAAVSSQHSTSDVGSVDQEPVSKSPLHVPSPQPPPPPPAPPEPSKTEDVKVPTPAVTVKPEVVKEEVPKDEPVEKPLPAPGKSRITKSTSAPKIVEPGLAGLKNVTPKKPTFPTVPSAPELQKPAKVEVSTSEASDPVPSAKRKLPPSKKTPEKTLSEAEAMPPPPLPQPALSKDKATAELDDATSMPPPDFVPSTSSRSRPRPSRGSSSTPKRTAVKRQATDDPELTNKIARIVADAAAQQIAIETSPPEPSTSAPGSRAPSKTASKPTEQSTPATSSAMPVRMRRKPATIYSPPSSPNRTAPTSTDTLPGEEGTAGTAPRKILTASRRKPSKADRTSEVSSRASSTTLKKRTAPVQQVAYRRFGTQSILSFPNRLGIQRRRCKRKSVLFRGVKDVKAVSRTCGTQTMKKIRTRKVRLIKNGAKMPKNLQDLLNKAKKNTSKTPNTIPVEIYADDTKVPNIWSSIEKFPLGQVTKKVCNSTDPTGVYHNPVAHFPNYYQVCKAPLFTDSINKKMASNQMTTGIDLQLHMALLAANCRVAATTSEEMYKASELGVKMLRSLDRQIFPSAKHSGTVEPKSNP